MVVTQARVLAWYVCTMPEGECGHIWQWTSICVATNMLHFWHSKNLPELIANCSAYLYSKGWSLWLWHFNTNVCTTIYTIHPTTFDYGSLLNFNEQMFRRLYRTGAYNDRHNGEFNKNSNIARFALYNHTNIF